MDRTTVFPASRQQSRLIRMENRFPPGLPVCTMGTYMKPYGSWPLLPEYRILGGLVLGIALCGRWWQKKEIPTALWLPLIGIVGGFLFSIIWEAQSRYVFPYYVFLILFVPMGLYETGRAISRLPKHRRKTTEQNQTQEESLREIA